MMFVDADNISFSQAVSFINQTNRHLFLTGNAGTGKTTFLKYIKANSFKKMVVVAPTGVAAINAGGVTIHSLFQVPPGLFLPAVNPGLFGNGQVHTPITLMRNLRMNAAKKELLRELELLVIDEVSMLRADMLDAMDTVLRHVRKKQALPFGGVQVLYIGDLYQLPPITRNDEWQLMQEYYNSPFFFDARVLQEVPPVFIELKKIYRQTDEHFINLLNKIRNNICTDADLQFLNSFYQPAVDFSKQHQCITLTSHNQKAETINQERLQRLPSRIHTYHAAVSGEFSERAFPADVILHLKEGAQVMFIKNDKGESRRFFNGKIATIKTIQDDEIIVSMPGEEADLVLEKETWRNIRYQYHKQKDEFEEEEIGSFTQYPVRLAWAITIHKSQGLTFDQAIIDAGASFAAGQVYVALSRLTSLTGLILLSRIQGHNISVDHRVKQFSGKELPADVLATILESGQQEFITHSVKKPFDWHKLVEIFYQLADQYEERVLPEKEMAVEWCGNLIGELQLQHETAQRFHQQLQALLAPAEKSYELLHQRTAAAATYFIQYIDAKLLPSLNTHLAYYTKQKRSKTYLLQLQDIIMQVQRQKKQLQNVVDVTAALCTQPHITNVLSLVCELHKPLPVESYEAGVPKVKKEKGATQQETLQMFRDGLTINQIAEKRNLAISTIETHLFSFIPTGEIDPLEFVSKEKLDRIAGYYNTHPTAGLAQAKSALGETFSYCELKAGLKYHQKASLVNKVTGS